MEPLRLSLLDAFLLDLTWSDKKYLYLFIWIEVVSHGKQVKNTDAVRKVEGQDRKKGFIAVRFKFSAAIIHCFLKNKTQGNKSFFGFILCSHRIIIKLSFGEKCLNK